MWKAGYDVNTLKAWVRDFFFLFIYLFVYCCSISSPSQGFVYSRIPLFIVLLYIRYWLFYLFVSRTIVPTVCCVLLLYLFFCCCLIYSLALPYLLVLVLFRVLFIMLFYEMSHTDLSNISLESLVSRVVLSPDSCIDLAVLSRVPSSTLLFRSIYYLFLSFIYSHIFALRTLIFCISYYLLSLVLPYLLYLFLFYQLSLVSFYLMFLVLINRLSPVLFYLIYFVLLYLFPLSTGFHYFSHRFIYSVLSIAFLIIWFTISLSTSSIASRVIVPTFYLNTLSNISSIALSINISVVSFYWRLVLTCGIINYHSYGLSYFIWYSLIY